MQQEKSEILSKKRKADELDSFFSPKKIRETQENDDSLFPLYLSTNPAIIQKNKSPVSIIDTLELVSPFVFAAPEKEEIQEVLPSHPVLNSLDSLNKVLEDESFLDLELDELTNSFTAIDVNADAAVNLLTQTRESISDYSNRFFESALDRSEEPEDEASFSMRK